jgi:hypothetical protein
MFLIVLIVLTLPAYGAVWDGGGEDGLWSNRFNWSGDVLPTSTSEILIEGPDGVVHLDVDFTLNDGGKLRISGYGEDAGMLIVDPGVTLTFNNSGLNVNSIESYGAVSVLGTVNIVTELRTSLFASLIVESGGELNIDGQMYANGRFDHQVMVNNGTVNLNSQLYVGAIVVNNGVFYIDGGRVSITERNYGSYGTFLNAGSGTLSNGGGETIVVGEYDRSNPNSLRNEGTFTFDGTIELYREMTNTGAMDLTDGTLDIACSGRFRNSGTLTLGTVYEACKVWDGDAGDGLWSNALNWSLDTAPTSTDNIDIGVDEYLTGSTHEVHLDVNFEIGAGKRLRHYGIVRTYSGQGKFYIDPNVTLTVSGEFVNNYGEVFNDGTIVNNDTLENRGHPNINVAVFDNNGLITNNGTLNNAGSPFDSSTNVAEYGLFNNLGTINNNDTINNINGTFTSSFATINNSGALINGIEGIMVLECTELTGNPVNGEPPTVIPCNVPPIADAGPDQVLECTGDVTAVTLDGSGSTDPDDDSLTYTWLNSFGTMSGVNPIVDLALGDHAIGLVVDDGNGETDSDDVLVTIEDTTPPSVDLGGDVTLEAEGPQGATFVVAPSVNDTCSGWTVVITPDQTVFPLGTTTVTVEATDDAGNSSETSVDITVQDTTPPVLTPPPDLLVVATGELTDVDIGVAMAEDLFGIASLENDAPALFPVGITVVTWTAIDGNNNQTQATQEVHVVYQFGGFLSPLRHGGLYKAGRVIPVRISVQLADGSFASGLNPTISLVLLSAEEPSGEPFDIGAVGSASAGNVAVEEDGHYQYNLSTSGLAPGSYRIFVYLGDGTAPDFIDIGLK